MKSREIIIGAIVVILLGLGVYYFLQNRDTQEPVVTPEPSPISVEDIESRFNVEIPSDAERAELRGEGASALATRKVEEDETRISVLADLADPAVGGVYQAWVEKEESDPVLLGTMSIAKGGYVIDFTTTDDLSGFDKIVVSSEENLDNQIETVVLEGNF